MERIILRRSVAERAAQTIVALALTLLAACGGGGSSNGTPGTPVANEPALVGTVTSEFDNPADPAFPGANPPAQIFAEVSGSSGYPRGGSTVDPDGTRQYNVALTLLDGPYLSRHGFSGSYLVSASVAPGRANLTPLTTLLVAQLLGTDPATAYATYTSSSADTIARITDADIAVAQSKVTAYLQNTLGVQVLSGNASFTQSTFAPKAGDPMYDTILALDAKLAANGTTLIAVADLIAAESRLCLVESLVITSGSTSVDFCPKSKSSTLDESDSTINVYTFVDSKGNALTVRARDATVLGVGYVASNGDSDLCSAGGCTGLTLGAVDADNGRDIVFAATALTGASSTLSLTGKLHGNKPGASFPTLACTTNNYFIAYPDNRVDEACVALDSTLGVGYGNAGRVGFGNTTRVRYTFSSDGSVTPTAANLEVIADGQTVESLFVQDIDPDTGVARGLYKCSGVDCNGVTVGPARDDVDSFAPYILRYRTITVADALLPSINVDGTTGTAGPATVRATIESFELVYPDGTFPADLPCSSGSQTLAVAFSQGNQSLTICPPTTTDPDSGFTLNYFIGTQFTDGVNPTFIAYNFTGNGRGNGIEVAMNGDAIGTVTLISGPWGTTYSCTGTACAGVTVSPPDGAGARTVTLSSTLLQEVDTANLLNSTFTATVTGMFIAPPP